MKTRSRKKIRSKMKCTIRAQTSPNRALYPSLSPLPTLSHHLNPAPPRSAYMPNILDGTSGPLTARFALVVSRYNEHITKKWLDGAVETLQSAAVPDDAIDVAWVPGA